MMKIRIFLLLFLAPIWVMAQENSASEVHQKLEQKQFVFEASQAQGTRGRTIFLDPGYTLVVKADQVVGNLPFFGRAYTASYGNYRCGPEI